MRKFLFFIWSLFIFPIILSAQSTTVSGTVQDAGSQTWNGGTFSITFSPSVANPVGPYSWSGGILGATINGTLSGSGTYSVSVPSNSAISPGGSQWRFQFCPLASSQCFNVGPITVFGGTQTVNATPPAIAINLLNPKPGNEILAYSTAEIVGATIGSHFYLIGTGMQVCSVASGNLCTTWVPLGGGASPAAPNFQAQVYNNGALSNTPCYAVLAPSTTSTASYLGCDNIVQGPNPYYDVRATQPSTGAHVRALNPNTLPAIPGLTGNCISGNNQIAMNAVTGLQVGDGIVARGCGAAPTMTTPGPPTVTPSVMLAGMGAGYDANSASGSTTYNYAIVARLTTGELTAASSTGTTTAGASTLGSATAPITCTRLNDTVSCSVTTGTHNFNTACSYLTSTVCGEVLVTGFTDPSFNGAWTVATAPTNTTFTWVSGFDTRTGATTSPTPPTTSGTAQWVNCNFLTWSPVANAWEYYLYRNGNVFSVSRPEGSGLGGASTNTDYTYEDYGATIMGGMAAGLPPWVPTTTAAAASATSSHLVTYITAINGNTITVATAPSTNVTGATIQFDNTAPFLGVYATVASQGSNGGQGGTVYFPPDINNNEYVFNSYVNLVLTSPNRLAAVAQMGTVRLNDTLEITAGQQWYCDRPFPQSGVSSGSFIIQTAPPVNIVTANPGVYIDSMERVKIQGCQFLGYPSNGAMDVFAEGAFDWSLLDNTYATGFTNLGSGTDYMGIGLYMRGGSQSNGFTGVAPTGGIIERNTWQTSMGSLPAYQSLTPLWMCQGCGLNNAKNLSVNDRGIIYHSNSGPVGTLTIDGLYSQGMEMPFVTGLNGTSFCPQQVFLDSQASTLYTGLSLASSVNPGILSCTFSRLVNTGQNVNVSGSRASTNQTQFPSAANPYGSLTAPSRNSESVLTSSARSQVFGTDTLLERQINGDLAVGTAYEMFIAAPPFSAIPTCTVGSGGTHTTGTYTYRVAPVWQNGSEGGSSQNSTSCTYTTGNQTGTVAWVAEGGNPKGYNLVEDTVPQAGGTLCNASPITTLSATVTTNCNVTSPVQLPAGGPTMAMSGVQGYVAPAYAVGNNGFIETITVPVESGNYSVTLPDNRGYIPTTGYQNSVFDNFNRTSLNTSGPCASGACWTITNPPNNAPIISGNLLQSNVSGQFQAIYWNANTFSNDQYSAGLIVNLGAPAALPMVRYNASLNEAYFCFSSISIAHLNSGTTTVLASGLSVNNGDMLWCDIVENAAGTSATITDRDLTTGNSITVSDATIPSGVPGIVAFSTGGQLDNWSGGNYHGIAQQDIEQTFQQGLHVAGPLTVGASEPTGQTGALSFGGIYSSIWAVSSGLCTDSTGKAVTTGCAAGTITGMTAGQVAIAGSATSITSSKPLQGTDANVLSSGTIAGTAAALCTDANGGATTSGCAGGAISGMTTGQVAIAGSASSITSSKALQGSDSNILTSSTIAAGAGNPLCTDTGSGATTSSCPNISGLTTGQIPVAGSATTLTSSKALQGTDSNILTSGTVAAGANNALCTDANSGATTSGCNGTVYNTQSSATNTNIAATNMVASTSALHSYQFSWTISLTAVGVGCSSSTTVNMNAIFTDPNTSSSITELLGTVTIAAGGNGTVGFVAQGTDNILAKTTTAVQYSTTGYTAGTGCTTNPTYQVSPTLVQLW